jgi:hypothetical protein
VNQIEVISFFMVFLFVVLEPVSSVYDNFDLHTEMVIPSSPVYGDPFAEEIEIPCFQEHFTRPSLNEQHFQRHQPPRFVNRSDQSAYSERRQQPLRHVNSHLNINYAQFPSNKIETKSQYYQNAPFYPSNTTNHDRRFGPAGFGRTGDQNLNVPSILRNQSHQQSNTDLSSVLDSNYNQSDAPHKINDADLFADFLYPCQTTGAGFWQYKQSGGHDGIKSAGGRFGQGIKK